jgi:hypothetical protein
MKTEKETEKEKQVTQRYAKIIELLVGVKKGAELETVIAEWARETKGRGDKAKTQKHRDAARLFDFHSWTSINIAYSFIIVWLSLPCAFPSQTTR